ncbi:MAG: hypothetical protein Rhob2KO_20860 [Rhodopirellula baltica]
MFKLGCRESTAAGSTAGSAPLDSVEASGVSVVGDDEDPHPPNNKTNGNKAQRTKLEYENRSIVELGMGKRTNNQTLR